MRATGFIRLDVALEAVSCASVGHQRPLQGIMDQRGPSRCVMLAINKEHLEKSKCPMRFIVLLCATENEETFAWWPEVLGIVGGKQAALWIRGDR